MLNKSNPLQHIAFEDINDGYCYANYGDFKVIMMKANGYINATKMCSDISEKTGSKKEYRKWKENQYAEELINEICSAGGYLPAELFKIITTGSKLLTEIRGTYVHPKLIPHIASWASPKFAIKVSDIVNKYFNDQALKEKEKLLQQKDDKIDELMKKVDQQTEQYKMDMQKQSDKMDKQSIHIEKLLNKNKRMSKKLDIMTEQNQDITQQNDEMLHKLDDVLEDRVVKTVSSRDQHLFVVMKDPTSDAKARYYVIRTKKKFVKSTIRRYQDTHKDAVVLLEIDYNPNSINLWDRCRTTLKSKIRCKLNTFGLKSNYTEDKLITDIRDINDEKYEVD